MSQDTFHEKHFPSTARKTIVLHFPRTSILKVSVASTCSRVFKRFHPCLVVYRAKFFTVNPMRRTVTTSELLLDP